MSSYFAELIKTQIETVGELKKGATQALREHYMLSGAYNQAKIHLAALQDAHKKETELKEVVEKANAMARDIMSAQPPLPDTVAVCNEIYTDSGGVWACSLQAGHTGEHRSHPSEIADTLADSPPAA